MTSLTKTNLEKLRKGAHQYNYLNRKTTAENNENLNENKPNELLSSNTQSSISRFINKASLQQHKILPSNINNEEWNEYEKNVKNGGYQKKSKKSKKSKSKQNKSKKSKQNKSKKSKQNKSNKSNKSKKSKN